MDPIPGTGPTQFRAKERDPVREIIAALFDKGMIQFGNTVLKSGKVSPIYINLRSLPSYPSLLRQVARELLRKIHAEQFMGSRLAGLPMSGLPVAVTMGVISEMPVLYARENARNGKMNIEGRYDTGETVIVIDDVLTDGAIKLHQIGLIRKAGLDVRDLIVVVDRKEGGALPLEEARIRVHSLMDLRMILTTLQTDCQLAAYDYARTDAYLREQGL